MRFRSPPRAAPSSSGCFATHLADVVELAFQSEPIELLEWKRKQQVDTHAKLGERTQEGPAALMVRAGDHRGIRNTPMRRDRLARPHRANLSRGVIAHGKYEIEPWRAALRELIPVLRAQSGRWQPVLLQQLERERVDLAGRAAAGAVRLEPSFAGRIQIGLGEDRPRRVPGAQEKDVDGLQAGPQQAALPALFTSTAPGRLS